jgi:hypothetical protein
MESGLDKLLTVDTEESAEVFENLASTMEMAGGSQLATMVRVNHTLSTER